MQVPDRLLRALRPSEHPGLLLATAYGAAVLSVAPFVVPAIVEHYAVGTGAASTVTAVQLLGFVAGSWGGGRFLRARGRILAIALGTTALANFASALLPPFGLLLGARAVSGLGLGIVTWYAWSLVFGDDVRTARVAVVAPVVSVVTTPVAAVVIEREGLSGLFVVLGFGALVPIALARRSGDLDPAYFAPRRPRGVRHRATPAATRVLVSLGLFTLGGSSVFVFGAVIAADRTDLSLTAISLAYSANAVAGIPAARWTGRRGPGSVWFAACAACAVGLGSSPSSGVFVVAIVAWGLCFWMGVPSAYSLLAARSRHPAERAGDAQAVMAAGRVVGPLFGGVVLDTWSGTVLGLAAGALMGAAALNLFVVDRGPSGPADPPDPA